VRSRGLGGAADEFVELYNPTDTPLTLDSGWTLEARSNSASSYGARWTGAGKDIPANGHYLIVGSAYTQTPSSDDSLTTGITDATSLQLLNQGSLVDALCYAWDTTSAAPFLSDTTYVCEGTPADNAPHDNTTSGDVDVSIVRKPGGTAGNCTDTGDNASDFTTETPAEPMSSSSTP
jgi:hypothetical protein